jgi:hypothetical protein
MERHDAEPGRGIHVDVARGERGTDNGHITARGGFGERGGWRVGRNRCERGGTRGSGWARFALRDRELRRECDQRSAAVTNNSSRN